MKATVEIDDVAIQIEGVPFEQWVRNQLASERLDARQRERKIVEAAYRDYLTAISYGPPGIPHCDDLVLHAPGQCEYCDEYPNRQKLRIHYRIGFTGDPSQSDRPCPATLLRSVEKINRWGGNVARP